MFLSKCVTKQMKYASTATHLPPSTARTGSVTGNASLRLTTTNQRWIGIQAKHKKSKMSNKSTTMDKVSSSSMNTNLKNASKRKRDEGELLSSELQHQRQPFPPPTIHNWPIHSTITMPLDTHTLPTPPLTHSHTLDFRIQAETKNPKGRARASLMSLPHSKDIDLPIFMPVGTQGTIKGITSQQIIDLKYRVILGNTYHLSLRPGADVIDTLGGIHEFMNMKEVGILTDSGGFQMVSLIDLAEISEEGVLFQSPVDGSSMMLTPEHSIHLQNRIGADIIMMLDDVVSSLTPSFQRFVEASQRTIRWLDRCIRAHAKSNRQNLFGIIQGGLDVSDGGLRAQNLRDMMERDPWLPGYAVGGLAGGEDKHQFWRVVAQCCRALPKNKPRYLMGVGYPVDLVVCTALGIDMFDCVWPCRTARFGTAIIWDRGLIQLNKRQYRNDTRNVIDETCGCSTCQYGKGYTRAYLSALAGRDSTACTLITIHNLYAIKYLMNQIRQSIIDQRHDEFVLEFMKKQYPHHQYPQWVRDALHDVGIVLPHPIMTEQLQQQRGVRNMLGENTNNTAMLHAEIDKIDDDVEYKE